MLDQDKLYFQDSKNLLKKINIINKSLIPSRLNSFQNSFYQKFFFKSQDSFLNNSVCYTWNRFYEQGFIFEQKESNREKFLQQQEIHLTKNHDTCVIVIGNDLSYGDTKENNLETRLQNTFGLHCAKLLQSDIFMATLANISNTDALFYLLDVLNYLKNYQYKNIKIIFQMIEYSKCMDSLLWTWNPSLLKINEQKHFDNEKQKVMKMHLGYHFIPLYKFVKILEVIEDVNFFSNSLLFSKKKISLTDFFKLYEWSIVDLLDNFVKLIDQTNLDYIVWKDYCKIMNTTKSKVVPTTWFDHIFKNVDLPFCVDTNWLEEFFINQISIKKTKNKFHVQMHNSYTYVFDNDLDIINFLEQKQVLNRDKIIFDTNFPGDIKEKILKNMLNLNENYNIPFDNEFKNQVMQERNKINSFQNNFFTFVPTAQQHSEWATKLLHHSGWLK